jgi:uncharacterized protein YlaI
MLNLVKDRKVTVNGIECEGQFAYEKFKQTPDKHIRVEINAGNRATTKNTTYNPVKKYLYDEATYRIKVKPYMRNSEFDFHDQWNAGIPMPHRIMEGKIIKETKGMYYMELTGVSKFHSSECPVCGKKLTSKISIAMGIGPECGGHKYKTSMSQQQIDSIVQKTQKEVQETTWSGWVIKKALQDMEEI